MKNGPRQNDNLRPIVEAHGGIWEEFPSDTFKGVCTSVRIVFLAPLKPTYFEIFSEYESRVEAIPDPTSLIVVDEADRMRMNSLEQLRSIFDENGFGMVLIGMPGIEKRIARYPQFFSRIGFVHEFRPLSDADIQVLLERRWAPVGIQLPAPCPEPELIAAVIRLTRGNFRLLVRLLTQMERVVAINRLETLSVDVVETARENLVIGQA